MLRIWLCSMRVTQEMSLIPLSHPNHVRNHQGINWGYVVRRARNQYYSRHSSRSFVETLGNGGDYSKGIILFPISFLWENNHRYRFYDRAFSIAYMTLHRIADTGAIFRKCLFKHRRPHHILGLQLENLLSRVLLSSKLVFTLEGITLPFASSNVYRASTGSFPILPPLTTHTINPTVWPFSESGLKTFDGLCLLRLCGEDVKPFPQSARYHLGCIQQWSRSLQSTYGYSDLLRPCADIVSERKLVARSDISCFVRKREQRNV